MPQCKLSNCRNQADPKYPKRYCTEHGENYLRKRKEYLAKQALRPTCVQPDCSNKLIPSQEKEGKVYCISCQELFDQQEQEFKKEREFYEADTLEKLKLWLQKYVL